MAILAKDAEAGRRYRCLDSGDIIEVCAKAGPLKEGRLVPLTTRDGSFVHVNAVSHKGRRIREKDPSAPLAIPAFYRLELYEGPYVKAPSRRPVAPSPTLKSSKLGRMPVRKGETPWRGWAARVRYDMEHLLEAVEAEGFWLAETFHYFRAGFLSETCMGIFKAGYLGFHSRPDGPLGMFPRRDPGTEPYLSWKIELGPVMAAERWEEMLDMLRRHLREFRRGAEHRSRGRGR